MKKLLTDIHTHTAFSTDGKEDIFSMLEKAKKIGLDYWGISEHFDYDYYVDGISFFDSPARFTDAKKYFSCARTLAKNTSEVHILVGAELGFTRNERVNEYYHAMIERYKPDFIVNSVHTQGKHDWYEREAFAEKTKKEAYEEYLSLVRDSLHAGYPYDIVGHIGYVTRFSPYADGKMRYEEFSALLDEILQTIIGMGKILEVNSSVSGAPSDFLPDEEILRRYYELGGRAVSFASDAHAGDRLADKREKVVAALRGIGFGYLTIPEKGKYLKAEI